MIQIPFLRMLVWLLTLALFGTLGCPLRSDQKQPTVSAKDIDLHQVPDGLFRGDFNVGALTHSVMVTVQNHRMIQIEIIKPAGSDFSRRCALCNAEDVTQRVLQAQSAEVDAHSGATATSRAVLKAIENALFNAVSVHDRPH